MKLCVCLQDDSFVFDVETEYAEPLLGRVFVVRVSYDLINADNVDKLVDFTGFINWRI